MILSLLACADLRACFGMGDDMFLAPDQDEALSKEVHEFHASLARIFDVDEAWITVSRPETQFACEHNIGRGLKVTVSTGGVVDALKEATAGFLKFGNLTTFDTYLDEKQKFGALLTSSSCLEVSRSCQILKDAKVVVNMTFFALGISSLRIEIEPAESDNKDFQKYYYPIYGALESATYNEKGQAEEENSEGENPSQEQLDYRFDQSLSDIRNTFTHVFRRSKVFDRIYDTEYQGEIPSGFTPMVRCAEGENAAEIMRCEAASIELGDYSTFYATWGTVFVSWSLIVAAFADETAKLDADAGWREKKVIYAAETCVVIYSLAWYAERFCKSALQPDIEKTASLRRNAKRASNRLSSATAKAFRRPRAKRPDLPTVSEVRAYANAVYYIADLRTESPYYYDKKFFAAWEKVSEQNQLREKIYLGLTKLVQDRTEQRQERAEDFAQIIAVLALIIASVTIISGLVDLHDLLKMRPADFTASPKEDLLLSFLSLILIFSVGILWRRRSRGS